MTRRDSAPGRQREVNSTPTRRWPADTHINTQTSTVPFVLQHCSDFRENLLKFAEHRKASNHPSQYLPIWRYVLPPCSGWRPLPLLPLFRGYVPPQSPGLWLPTPSPPLFRRYIPPPSPAWWLPTPSQPLFRRYIPPPSPGLWLPTPSPPLFRRYIPPPSPAWWCGTAWRVESRGIAYACQTGHRSPCPALCGAARRSGQTDAARCITCWLRLTLHWRTDRQTDRRIGRRTGRQTGTLSAKQLFCQRQDDFMEEMSSHSQHYQTGHAAGILLNLLYCIYHSYSVSGFSPRL